jgi:tRNA (guanine37-N1)-methyltransferase
MFFEILTLFPGMFEGAFTDSIVKRAAEKKLISITITNIRDFSTDAKHHTVDDYLYGGEPGMLLEPQPVADAIRAGKARLKAHAPKVIHLTPQGERLSHEIVLQLLEEQSLILLCGRYKGVDQRVVDTCVDREISIGDYVLSGGEVPAMVIVDAVTRLIPGVLGDRESAEGDSFYRGLLSPPHYTRPEVFEGLSVPPVLISGHHENIRKWQEEQAAERTKRFRPDLWERHQRETRAAEGRETDKR